MIHGADPWAVLGIAPTDDVSAIRRAYAQRLKAIDMDRDADGFGALREARDEALAEAANGPVADRDVAAGPMDESAEPAASPFGPDLAALTAPALDPPFLAPPDTGLTVRASEESNDGYPLASPAHAATGPAQDSLCADSSAWDAPRLTLDAPVATVTSPASGTDAHYQAIWALLMADELQAMSDRVLREQFEPHFHAIIHDPRMAEIAVYGNAEQWFAEILARSCPRSDPLIDRVATPFGWMDRAGEVGQPAAVMFLTDRLQLLRMHEELRSGRHRLSPAWRELTKLAGERSVRGVGVSRKKVRELLSLVRTRYPDLESQFDWYRVQMWEAAQAVPRSYGGYIFLALFALQLIGMCCRYVDRTERPSQAAMAERDALTTADADVDAVLKASFGPTAQLATMRTSNAELADALTAFWAGEKAAGKNRWDFRTEFDDWMLPRLRAAAPRASYATAVELLRIRIARAELYRAKGWGECELFLGGGNPAYPSIPDELSLRLQAARFRLFLEADGAANPPPPDREGGQDKRIEIPGAVVEAVSRRTGISPNALGEAWMHRATPREHCIAGIALLETVVSLPPKRALPLLRQL